MRQSRLLIRAATIATATMVLAVPGWLVGFVGSATANPTPTPTPPVSTSTAPATGGPAPLVTPAASPGSTATPTPAEPPSPPPGEQPPEPDGRKGLPVTGAQVGGMVVLGGGLIAAGIAMVAVRRRDLSDLDFVD
ncbi:MAG TPA: LPXTG cell wall anchor domain-containing protein [Natronosporangium sp.]|nr:LPXTG cell wall anchor domain-containing protein [Natronosporangium sp.]